MVITTFVCASVPKPESPASHQLGASTVYDLLELDADHSLYFMSVQARRHSQPDELQFERRCAGTRSCQRRPPPVRPPRIQPTTDTSGPDFAISNARTDEERHAQANRRRLAALAEKEAARNASGPPNAVVVSSTVTKSKITFDSDGEAEAQVVPVGFGDSMASSKKKKALFDDSDDDDDVFGRPNSAAIVAFRPEFAGPDGKKLFDLQKRFGGDDRFRLDARFMDEFDGDDGVPSDTTTKAVVDDSIQAWRVVDAADVAARQEEEKAEQIRALEMLQDLFPDMKIDKGKWTMNQAPDQKQLGWLASMRRYDPRDTANAKTMEAAPTESVTDRTTTSLQPDSSDDSDADGVPNRVDTPLPPASTERYFAATSALSTMFSRVRANSEDGEEMEAALDGLGGKHLDSAATAPSVFSFASMFDAPVENEVQDWSAAPAPSEDADDSHRTWHFMDAIHKADDKDDGSTDGDNDVDDAAEVASTNVERKRPVAELLSFGATFFKPEVWTADHEAAWVAMRKTYTVDFRRKHKQALKNRKQAKKTAASVHAKKK
ncbi:hypothetical protein DYB32_005908 [Aphanomyces invadans]|uniref:Uncharacterized protein n=1 Tax=Aphanomyces invadans TaxID=157072 RepID=A0A418ASW6_9STRA|nr:hypothetical protein DYB32_005908 [Aphanomyces invadans]